MEGRHRDDGVEGLDVEINGEEVAGDVLDVAGAILPAGQLHAGGLHVDANHVRNSLA